MKIDDFTRLVSVQGTPELQKKDSTKPNESFTALLNDEISQREEVGGKTAASGIHDFLPFPVTPVLSTNSETVNRLAAIEDVVAKMQALVDGLGGGASPKSLDGVVKDLGNLSATIEDKLGEMGEDPKLKDIAEEVNIAAFMESVKWRRGDYL
ncbi:MAG: hypothetical protein AAGU11_13565 [Syntrophobacteraceae bacterium]